MSSPSDHGPPPPHQHIHVSPLRRVRPPSHAPTTPATIAVHLREERALHQPSPNRTEAAAAMMHLFSSSAVSTKSDDTHHMRLPPHPPLPVVKAKRKYVRKVPRKPSPAAKKLVKITEDTKDDQDETMSEPTATPGNEQNSVDADEEMAEPGSPKENDSFAPFREYNRKEKSLGLLCENFLRLYKSDQVTEICLDRAASELGVERRRIYDIVNILESIHLVSRKSKNLYNWHGLAALPVSTTAMKKKYVEMQMQGDSCFDYNFKDRRRGKSLSKLSQMFVQLFLKKDHCIIPLDQAAKQLIQMEESENEEDRQLKTKIRRLYDVANVLVSVGLIEKMQLTNSRKPVFRWKYRGDSTDQQYSNTCVAPEGVSGLVTRIRLDDFNAKPIKTEISTLGRKGSQEDGDALRTSQSCESDNGSDCSDSQSETGLKRKPSGRSPNSGKQDGNNKRTRTSISSPTGTPRSNNTPASILRFNQSNVPIHPQIVYQEQQLQVRQYMERYIHEYIDYMILQQVRRDPLSLGGSTTTRDGVSPSSTGTSVDMLNAKEAAASIVQDIHRTPMNIPSLMSRVSGELAGSIRDMLFSTNSTSPQSVAELLPLETRNVTKSLQLIGLKTPPQNSSPSKSGKKPLHTDPSTRRVANSPDSASSGSRSPSSPDSSSDDQQTQARRLFKSFQPSAHSKD